MQKENIIIIGASGHAKVIIDIIKKENKFNILGLLDDDESKKNKIFCEYKIFGSTKILPDMIKKYHIHKCIIAIGDNIIRNIVKKRIKKENKNLEFATCIHPSAIISSDVKIGQGVVIMANVAINNGAHVKDFCIINTSSTIEHDCNIGKFTSLAPNVTIGGQTSIGKFSAISLGVNIIHMIKIGKYCIIGAGSTVVKNINNFSLAYGVPAKVIKKRKKSDKYL